MRKGAFFLLAALWGGRAFCQDTSDVEAVRRMVNLSEVVVRSDLNVSAFLQRIKNDTTFYKAFRNLRILGFTSLNDIRMQDKKGKVAAWLQSKTRQNRKDGCRTMDVLEEKTGGDIYDRNKEFNYTTAGLYASLFFTKGRVCGETNIVKGTQRNVKGKGGIEKHKEQLKMLFFNPGKKIPGIPFIGDKLDIFDKDVARYYTFSIDTADYRGQPCYLFRINRRPGLSAGEKSRIVFDNINTWFHSRTMEIVARNYDLSYNAAVYDFNVHMEVQMTRFQSYLVPQLIRYNGDWDVPFKKRERGIFTATLFDFKN
ncbi:hypothetical protein V9K67_05195 [Paraflavisolibacter sp. H34]|uniref:hypothetical protein n=1 Tax=Huijunlia imazamoxiresistens TaxID=3127457 RepID=UPI00301AFBC5